MTILYLDFELLREDDSPVYLHTRLTNRTFIQYGQSSDQDLLERVDDLSILNSNQVVELLNTIEAELKNQYSALDVGYVPTWEPISGMHFAMINTFQHTKVIRLLGQVHFTNDVFGKLSILYADSQGFHFEHNTSINVTSLGSVVETAQTFCRLQAEFEALVEGL